MPLLSGVRLGIYEVLELIGMGGMGEVYRARDARLNRDVAIKILPSHVAADPDRLARFKREAQVLASLNHSNVGSIYGFEESDGVQALILELVDGPTLADRIAQGPIPLDEALPIAVQICHALEAAHERGIVHRDLKPANIKVRSDGTVKVLDFGLAKALANDSAPPETLATITSPALTRLGVILGTAAYMSPEQARGKEADKRSDIWAFGCVLYEMLTAKRAFEGSEVSDTLASILKSDPDWTALPEHTSSGIRRILRRCLEKDPRRRFHDIADVRLEIEEPPAQEIAPISAKGRLRERAAWAVAAASLMLLGAQAAYVRMKPAPAAEVSRFQIYPPPNSSFGGLGASSRATNVAVSPDGTRLVFVAMDRAGKDMLWMQPFDSFDALPLAGTDGASYPFWEPHAASIGFFVGSKLKKISAAGGSPQTICDVVNESPRGGTWGSGGDIVFSSGSSPRLYRVDADGGTPLPLATQADPVTVQAMWPYFLPDGRTFLYYGSKAGEGPGVYAASIAPGATPKKLLSERTNAAFDPSGFLLFTRGGALLRQRFDPIRLEVSGETRRVAERVALTPEITLAAFSVSNTGVLAFQPDDAGSTQFAWFDRTGQLLERVGPPGRYRFPSLSPDRKRLLYMDFSDLNLWILDMGRQIPSKFTTGPAPCPVWSSDGGTILYFRPTGSIGIYQKSASAAGEETLLFKGERSCLSQVSPDGKWLLYFGIPEGESAYDIYVIPMTGDKTPQRIVQSPFEDAEPRFSPDGRFVAFTSTSTGRSEVYVQPFPATGEQWRVSNQGGREPLWGENGHELFFLNDDRKFFAVQIKPGPKFDFGTPQFLFDMRVNFAYARNSYIPSPDGQRFLVNTVLDTTSPPIHVVRNWTAGLKN